VITRAASIRAHERHVEAFGGRAETIRPMI
jgi:hypothetical protein